MTKTIFSDWRVIAAVGASIAAIILAVRADKEIAGHAIATVATGVTTRYLPGKTER